MLATYDLSEFSNKLKQIRNASGFTVNRVSNATGISASTIKTLEKGQVVPRFDTLQLLSAFYKIDLISLLNEYKDSTNIISLYNTLNNYMASGDNQLIKKVLLDISHLLENNDLKPIDKRNLIQLKNYFKNLEIASQCSPKTFDLNERVIQNLIETLRISNPNFTIEHIEASNYFSIEYNILFSISSLLGLNRDCEKSNRILLHILKHYLTLDLKNYYTKFFSTKTLYMISYNYHRIDQHNLALEYADKGIQFCNDNDTFCHLPLLLARKGIALYHLQNPEWKLYYDQTIAVLKIQNKYDQIETFDEVFNNLLR